MQEWMESLNEVIVVVCQLSAMGVIVAGVVKALIISLKDALTPGSSAAAIRESRVELGHALSLALGFLIGASILKTSIAPNWTDIGQLAAVIAVRTALNFFLLRDLAASTSGTQAGGQVAAAPVCDSGVGSGQEQGKAG